MKKAAAAPPASVIDLRFGQVGLLQVRLREVDAPALRAELTARIASAPQFFQHTGVCLDLSALEQLPAPEVLRGVIEAIGLAGLRTVGVCDTSPAAEQLASALDLPVLGGFRQLSRPPAQLVRAAKAAAPAAREPEPAPEPVAPPPPTTGLVHTQPVRSGQRVFARDRDLIVTAVVGAGAEVMADGCVHVYGALRGRVMAGVRGDTSARVFCQEFRAELVAIAGVFRVFETLPAELAGQPVMAWLEGEALRFTRLGA